MGIQLQVRGALAETQQPGGGQRVVERIEQRQQQQVDVARQQAQLLLGGIVQGPLVAEDHREAAGPQHFACPAQREAERFGIAGAFRVQLAVGPGQPVQQLQQALLAAPWLDFLLLAAAEHQPADPVVVAQRGPADQARGLGREHRLEGAAAAEE